MRWNSSYYMVERVVELQQPICAALLELKRSELMPSDTELAAMSDYLFVVDPLVQIIMVQPLLHKLLNVHLMSSPTDSNSMKKALCWITC